MAKSLGMICFVAAALFSGCCSAQTQQQKTGDLSKGWSIKELHPCPDTDPLGLFTDADCDPVKPKKKLNLKETAKCTKEQFYADPQQCKSRWLSFQFRQQPLCLLLRQPSANHRLRQSPLAIKFVPYRQSPRP